MRDGSASSARWSPLWERPRASQDGVEVIDLVTQCRAVRTRLGATSAPLQSVTCAGSPSSEVPMATTPLSSWSRVWIIRGSGADCDRTHPPPTRASAEANKPSGRHRLHPPRRGAGSPLLRTARFVIEQRLGLPGALVTPPTAYLANLMPGVTRCHIGRAPKR